MPSEVYLVLGPLGSGRRAIIRRLVEDAVDASLLALILHHAGDPDDGDDLKRPRHLSESTWHWDEETLVEDDPAAVEASSLLFFIADGKGDPADMIAAFKDWLNRHQLNVSRVITVVPCKVLLTHPDLAAWFDACIHFSDCALLTDRHEVPQKWIQNFQEPYKKACFPCLFEMVKKNRTNNPVLILDTQSLRMSQIFDLDADPIDDLELDEDNLPEEPFDLVSKPDPYLERNAAGKRKKPLPDINDYLE